MQTSLLPHILALSQLLQCYFLYLFFLFVYLFIYLFLCVCSLLPLGMIVWQIENFLPTQVDEGKLYSQTLTTVYISSCVKLTCEVI